MARSSHRPGLGLLAPVVGCVPGHVERALQVDADDRVELVLAHRDEHAVTQDARVVHDDVEVAEARHGLVDHGLGPGEGAHAVGVGHGLAARGGDLVGHGLGRRDVRARSVDRAAQVVDHDLGPERGEEQRVLAADATSAPGDDRDPVLQHPCHRALPRSVFSHGVTPCRARRRTETMGPGAATCQAGAPVSARRRSR